MKYLLTFVFGLSLLISNAQQNAITGNGEEVLLYEDGTWEYLNDSLNIDEVVSVNDQLFTKNKSSSFLVKSKMTNVGVYLNPKVWSFTNG